MKILDMPPFAPVLMESTRAMGYSLESAVADIIDNSIAANASNVDIQFSPYDAVPFISILDNGDGMTKEQINDAMRYGSQSSLNIRDSKDLGRFGLGLKTASLSQCRCLTVITKQGRRIEARRWDLDEIYEKGTWALLSLNSEEIHAIPQFQTQLKSLKSGTLVLWEKLDRMLNGAKATDKLMSKQMEYVREHLALVFHTSHNADGSVLQLQKHRRYAGKGVGFLIWQIWHCSKNLSVRRSVLLLSTELPRKKNLFCLPVPSKACAGRRRNVLMKGLLAAAARHTCREIVRPLKRASAARIPEDLQRDLRLNPVTLKLLPYEA